MLRPVWKPNVAAHLRPRPNHGLHAIDATPARWRGDVGSSPLDGASTHATHWLISTQVATFAEQAKWHGRADLLGDVLDWGFPLMALPSLYGAARFEAVWNQPVS